MRSARSHMCSMEQRRRHMAVLALLFQCVCGAGGAKWTLTASGRRLNFLEGAFGTLHVNSLANATRYPLHRQRHHHTHPPNTTEEAPFEAEPGPEVVMQPLPVDISATEWGPRPEGQYSSHAWARKVLLDSKFRPSSHCGINTAVAFRSKYKVPHQRKCINAHKDTPLYSVLLANPSLADKGAIQALKSHFAAEWMALWSGASQATHSNKVASSWLKLFSGPNDFLVFSKAAMNEAELADRLLKATASRLALVVMNPAQDLPRVTTGWIYNAAALFHQHPRLGVVGMTNVAAEAPGFAFTANAGPGPWLVRRDSLIEGGAVGFVDFCIGMCSLSEGLGALTWMGGFQVAQLSQRATTWPVEIAAIPSGTVATCRKIGRITVNEPSIEQAVKEAMKFVQAGSPSDASVAVKKPCQAYRVTTGNVVPSDAQCGAPAGGKLSASILVQYFKRPTVIKSLLKALDMLSLPHEVLINDDSRSEHDAFLSRLGRNGALFHSPNVHEIRGYNRLARYARGDIIVMMQDDDKPSSGKWVGAAQLLFNGHKKLALIGGLRGRMDVGAGHDKDTNQNAGKKYGPRFGKIKTSSPATKAPFMFCYKVNAAPLLTRRHVLMQLGGLQEAFSCPGDAGIGFDFEYSIRLWRSGYQVGLYNTNFQRPQPGKRGNAGTRSNDKKWNIRRHNEKLNNGLLYKMYPGFHHVKGTALAMEAFRNLSK